MDNKYLMIKNKKAAIINLGCKVNKYETDAMKEKLKTAGMRIVGLEEKADVYIVNTCSVTNMAQKKSRQMLRRMKKKNPDAVIVAAGCYVNAEHDMLKQEDFVDILVGNNLKKDIAHVIAEYYYEVRDKTEAFGHQTKQCMDYYMDIGNTREYEEMGGLDSSVFDHRRAYIKIQDGCNQFCSYCIIPYTRGRVRSRHFESILMEIKKLAEEGIKEFVLTGIHISSYGLDYAENSEECITDLGELVKAIENIPEVKRIRLGSLEPRIITEAFLDKIGNSEKLCPHFHLSLQSGCNATLSRMNRKYSIEDFCEKCRMLRMYFDQPAITTDVIVGFPGETEEEFATTLSNLEKLNLYEIHVFKYSVRSGTAAEKLEGQVPEEIKGRRSDILLDLTARQKQAYETKMSGYTDEVLVEEGLTAPKGEYGELKDAVVLGEENAPVFLEENIPSAENKIQYFTGHTKRYVKVKIVGNDNMINQIVKVRII